MVGEPCFTRDDLDELSDTADDADEPAEVAAELIHIAEGRRLADAADQGYAYLLAAEIYERADALADALTMAERALVAYQESGDRVPGAARALRGELLLRLDRHDDAMAVFVDLRPLLATDALAASYVPEALAAGGRPDLASQWLTEALAERSGATPDDPVVAQLIATRERLADGPGDDLTDPGDGLGGGTTYPEPYGGDPAASILLGDDLGEGAEAVLLVWPEQEYERVDEQWPEVLEATGADDWEDYRRRHQVLIMSWQRRHRAPLWQVTGTADGFAEFLVEVEADPMSVDLVSVARRYGDYLADRAEPQPLPPERDDPCWCGSGLTYQACCLRLATR